MNTGVLWLDDRKNETNCSLIFVPRENFKMRILQNFVRVYGLVHVAVTNLGLLVPSSPPNSVLQQIVSYERYVIYLPPSASREG